MIITTSAGCSERRWDAARGSIGISLRNYNNIINMEETQVELSGQERKRKSSGWRFLSNRMDTEDFFGRYLCRASARLQVSSLSFALC